MFGRWFLKTFNACRHSVSRIVQRKEKYFVLYIYIYKMNKISYFQIIWFGVHLP